jgi:glycosyltransferase involved in cell wall biosynthesis
MGEWLERITQVTTDDKLNRRLGDYGRRWVSERFGWETIARQVESLLLKEAAN